VTGPATAVQVWDAAVLDKDIANALSDSYRIRSEMWTFAHHHPNYASDVWYAAETLIILLVGHFFQTSHPGVQSRGISMERGVLTGPLRAEISDLRSSVLYECGCFEAQHEG